MLVKQQPSRSESFSKSVAQVGKILEKGLSEVLSNDAIAARIEDEVGGMCYFTPRESKLDSHGAIFQVARSSGGSCYFYWRPLRSLERRMQEHELRVTRTNCTRSQEERFALLIMDFLRQKVCINDFPAYWSREQP